jgi:hypothetical protein
MGCFFVLLFSSSSLPFPSYLFFAPEQILRDHLEPRRVVFAIAVIVRAGIRSRSFTLSRIATAAAAAAAVGVVATAAPCLSLAPPLRRIGSLPQ